MTIRGSVQKGEGERKGLSEVGIVSVSKLFFVFLIFSAFVTPVFVSAAFGVAGEDVAALAVEDAEASVVSAYEAVLDAERVGADVSGLLTRLTVAGQCLADARFWVELGDYDSANLCYENATRIGEEVEGEAQALRTEAYSARVTDLVLRMTVSVVGVVVIVLSSFLVWRVFKRRYQRRVLEMRPEVASDES